MMGFMFTRGSLVEVSRMGSKDSWYAATVVDASQTKTKAYGKRIGYLVRYNTLYEDDDMSVPLTEMVDSSFLRPLPPRYPRRKDDDNGYVEEQEGGRIVFGLCDVVDAYHLDGWWAGVVNKVIVDGGITKYFVSFESFSEQFEFRSSELRLHLDWIDDRWRVRPKKTIEEEWANGDSAQTSKSDSDAHSGFVTPSKGAFTGEHSDKPIVGFQLSAKKISHSRREAETNVKTVGAVDDSLTCNRIKRTINCVEEHSHAKRFKPSSGSKGKTEDMRPVMEAGGSQAMLQDSPLLEQEMIMTKTYEAEDGKSHEKRKRGSPPKLCLRRPNSLLEGSLRFSALDHHDRHNGAVNQAIVDNGETPEKHQELPFIKRSPFWTTIESLELYQKPHFSPLKKIKEDYREGLAIAYVVTFANLVQRTSKLQLADPTNIIESSLETLHDLESHGFDVGAVQARLDELLSTKTKIGQLEDELKEAASELEKHNLEMSIVEDEINQLEVNMKELQDKLVLSVTMKDVKNEKIRTLQSILLDIAERVADAKHNFEKLVTTPL